MKEYIDREATIKRFQEIKQSGVSFKDAIFLDGAMAVVENIPAADVVEVVRCFECNASNPTKTTNTVYCMAWDRVVSKNGFCSYGERREENEV